MSLEKPIQDIQVNIDYLALSLCIIECPSLARCPYGNGACRAYFVLSVIWLLQKACYHSYTRYRQILQR
jgi:hypothetical protein